jgi:hypothetical protein
MTQLESLPEIIRMIWDENKPIEEVRQWWLDNKGNQIQAAKRP